MSTLRAIRVVLAEDPAYGRGALAALLKFEPDIDVVAQADDGRAAVAALVAHAPDVLVTDAEIPNMNGLELAAVAERNHPGVKVVLLTAFDRGGDLAEKIRSVVRGAARS